MDMGKVWDYYSKVFYDKEYINSLAKFLKENNITSIFDCACGAGFPSIELKKQGFDMLCSDGSEDMIKVFEQNLKQKNIDIPHFKADWKELNKKINNKFDLVMCRGNSLPYANSWDKNSQSTLQDIKGALETFYKLIKEGGILYVDTIHEKDYATGGFEKEIPEKIIDGKKIQLVYKTIHDENKKTRIWYSIIKVDGKEYKFEYEGYLLKHEELINTLKEVGFKDIKKIKLDGENHFSIFIAEK